jgi:hypothetical protein
MYFFLDCDSLGRSHQCHKGEDGPSLSQRYTGTVRPSVCLSVHMFVYLIFFCPSFCLSICLYISSFSVRLSVCPCLSVFLIFFCPFICLSVPLSIRPSVCPHLFVCLSHLFLSVSLYFFYSSLSVRPFIHMSFCYYVCLSLSPTSPHFSFACKSLII